MNIEMRSLVLSLLLGLPALIAGASCGGDSAVIDTPTPAPTPSPTVTVLSPEDALKKAQEAVDASKGYTITVEGKDLALPEWGSIDRGSIAVNTADAQARAEFERSGDGSYFMILRDRQTYFQRESCDRFARVPGGGQDVFAPFLWTSGGILETATNVKEGKPLDPFITLSAELKYLGLVEIALEPQMLRPRFLRRLEDPKTGGATDWDFSNWDFTYAIPSPAPDTPDKAPGGDPC